MSIIKVGHRNGKKFNWGLKLAKAQSIFLRNDIVECSLAVQRKISNAGHSYTIVGTAQKFGMKVKGAAEP